MTASLYITPTLFNAWQWYMRSEQTKDEFLAFLNKVKTPPTEAMLKGLKFEDDVQNKCNGIFHGEDDAYGACVSDVADIVRDGLWQETVGADFVISGQVFYLFGKADVIKRDWIYDLKFTGSYDIGKYSDSVQHLIYMYATGIKKFGYLPSDGRSVYREDYFWTPESLETLRIKLTTMIEHIMSDPDFSQAYLNNWNSEPKRQEAA